jgi:predicted metal-dependent HD superfamily phosphohydrolase
MFEQVFTESIQRFTPDPALAKRLWEDIRTHYSSSGRHYHNLTHLDHLTDELLQVKDRIANWDILVFAIAYHDIIYDTTRSDNEVKSAEYASTILSGLLTSSQMEICKEAILATKGHQHNPNPDINYFTDADLSILGASPEPYIEYSKQVKGEYASYPDIMYQSGRQKVLDHFLRMPRIFKTDFFFAKYENQARNNLKMELDLLIKDQSGI